MASGARHLRSRLISCNSLSFLVFWIERKENLQKTRICYPNRLPKIPRREKRNAKKNKEFLAEGKIKTIHALEMFNPCLTVSPPTLTIPQKRGPYSQFRLKVSILLEIINLRLVARKCQSRREILIVFIFGPSGLYQTIMGSQHPSPNVKTLCNFKPNFRTEIITSRAAKNSCFKGSRTPYDVISWKRGRDPHPPNFCLTRKTARSTKGQFHPH